SREIERPVRVMDKQRPAAGADQPLYGDAPAVRSQPVSALAVAIVVCRASPVELRPAFTEAQDRLLADRKAQRAGLGAQSELLYQSSTSGFETKRQCFLRKFHDQIAAARALFPRECGDSSDWRGPCLRRQRSVHRNRLRGAVFNRGNG